MKRKERHSQGTASDAVSVHGGGKMNILILKNIYFLCLTNSKFFIKMKENAVNNWDSFFFKVYNFCYGQPL